MMPSIDKRQQLKPELRQLSERTASDIKTKAARQRSNFLSHVVILGTVDFVCVLILVLILGGLPQKAEEIRNLRSLNFKESTQSDVGLIESDIMFSQPKVGKLKDLFPDERGLINFIKEIDQLKKEGIISHFSFASNNVVQDKTKFVGLPMVIEFRGAPSQIDVALQKLQRLPYLIRPINVEIKQDSSKDWVILKYGGILYASEDLAKD